MIPKQFATIVLGFLLAACASFSVSLAPVSAAEQSSTAKPGDSVMVIVHPVRAEARKDYEEFVTHFFAGLERVGRKDRRTATMARQSRLVHPTKAAADGTWHYLVVLDPVVPGGDYDIRNALRQIHPGAEGEVDRWYKQWLGSLAGRQVIYEGVQQAK